jgi:serine/threonine protein phosphatase PrpC
MNKLNQDTYLIYPDIKKVDNIDNEHFIKILGVFDGHGDNGHIISKEIKHYFLDYFNKLNLAEPDDYYKKLCENNYEEIFNLFKEIDKKLHDKYSDEDNNICNNSGTTASLVILFRNKIISINLGHSKSIIIHKDNKITQLNRCHLPELEEEKKRIEENGGEVKREEWSKEGPKRICYKKSETKKYSGLSVSRSFGDFASEQIGVIAIPEIKEFDVNYGDINIMVMCTNGIWEFLTNEKVKDIILPYYDENNISGGISKLINVSNKIWSVKNPMYIDDLSAILLFFDDC